MHNQHRSPDPTKIERATATSTVTLFIYFFAEHAVSISTFLDTQESFQKAQVKDMCGGDFFRKHMSEKKWPILDNHTDQLTCQSKDLEKP
jgi:hypothetical protein